MQQPKLLSLLVKQFEAKHGRAPQRIIIHPMAMLILAVRGSVGPVWQGIPIVCEDVKPLAVAPEHATALGVVLNNSAVQGFDL